MTGAVTLYTGQYEILIIERVNSAHDDLREKVSCKFTIEENSECNED